MHSVLSKSSSPLFVNTSQGRASFKTAIYDYYRENKRSFAWRHVDDPYFVVVSEIMLQQTQTDRVKEKYEQFIREFPNIAVLAQAPLAEVITVWQGLGYNRRALALHSFAQRVLHEYEGSVPAQPAILETFKGIGPATAASICAFAFNKPTLFIETNIRTVFIHCFFPAGAVVHDKEILPLVEATLDSKDSRNWYYALMDYGVMLKKTHKNPSRKSAHYAVQSRFEGSDRQVRGRILKMLVETPRLAADSFIEGIERSPEKIISLLCDLESEGFIRQYNGIYSLS